MKEILKRFKSVELSKKNILLIFLAVGVAVVLLFSELFADTDEENVSVDNTAVYASQYTKELEKELESLLSEISGAGKVQVMVTLENCYENVYAKGYTTKTEEGESESHSELTEEYIVVKQGSNNEECLVVKVYEPTVKGVAVVAQGADNIRVKTAITETVCALFNISSAKVSVEKMNG